MTPEQLETLVLEAIGDQLRDGLYHCDWHAAFKQIKELPADDLPVLAHLFEGGLHFRGWLLNGCEISVIGGRFISWNPEPVWTWEAAIFCNRAMLECERCTSNSELPSIIKQLTEHVLND